jgi:hypothetical protein
MYFAFTSIPPTSLTTFGRGHKFMVLAAKQEKEEEEARRPKIKELVDV